MNRLARGIATIPVSAACASGAGKVGQHVARRGHEGRAAASLTVLALLSGCGPQAGAVAGSARDGGTGASDDAGVAQPATPPPVVEPEEARLSRFLVGHFDSADQAKADPSYFVITLDSCPVVAPEIGPRVLYVEQARPGSPPYRQRLYVLEAAGAHAATSRVLELADPKPMVGACTRASPPTLRAIDATERSGCTVAMHWTGDAYVGHTPDARWNGSTFEPVPGTVRCASTLQGATFATTDVRLDASSLRSWDRGWDASGKQVWGATAGPYVFVRRSSLAQPGT